MDCPAAWVQDIARHVKKLAPKKLFVDGTYGVNTSHLTIDEVDIFSNHYYPISITKLKDDLEKVGRVNKPYFAGEYGWNVNGTGDGSLAEWFKALEASPAAVGDTFWSLFGRNVPNCNVSFFFTPFFKVSILDD
jgi:mannan endo-1,4-beta-mannosidase